MTEVKLARSKCTRKTLLKMFSCFAGVNHHSGPISKQKLTSTGFKRSRLWAVRDFDPRFAGGSLLVK